MESENFDREVLCNQIAARLDGSKIFAETNGHWPNVHFNGVIIVINNVTIHIVGAISKTFQHTEILAVVEEAKRRDESTKKESNRRST